MLLLKKKVLYGLKQAGRMQNERIINYLKSIGFIQYKFDIYLLGRYSIENKLMAALTLYVYDDINYYRR